MSCKKIQHPLIEVKMTEVRNVQTDPKRFRDLITELSSLILFEATKNLNLEIKQVITPTQRTFQGSRIRERVGFFPILRAGLGMVQAALDLIPEAIVYHIGMYRDSQSLLPIEYYNKLPSDKTVDVCYVLDPALATGGTAIATIEILKSWGATKICFVAILASSQGIAHLHSEHSDVEIYTCAIDDSLDERGFIIPGFGDSGDRQFGTA
eukprot:TRINITY_DN139_c0_g1_i1.p1 TRINITY_DN139_c0_g1~~TRINITY_DN139_c0_g1_i1.p1  ORF type:complete len:209 (-),score=85.08 TRINITY_DN139_c0_g1_i1:180-806(-)